MIFAENVDKSMFDGILNKGLKIDGKLATIIVANDFDGVARSFALNVP